VSGIEALKKACTPLPPSHISIETGSQGELKKFPEELDGFNQSRFVCKRDTFLGLDWNSRMKSAKKSKEQHSQGEPILWYLRMETKSVKKCSVRRTKFR